MKEILTKIRFLLLPIPMDADEFFIIHNGTRVAFFLPTYKRFDLPKGKHEIFGRVSQLTKEQARELVETIHIEIPPSPSNDMGGDWDIGYVDYQYRGEYAGWGGDAGCFKDPIESFHSLLKVHKMGLKSWLQEPKMGHWGENMLNTFNRSKEIYDNTPEDYLIIKILDEE